MNSNITQKLTNILTSLHPLNKERMARVLGKAPRIEKIEPSADRAIDRLVSPSETSYGLSEEEIKVVEGS